MVTLPAETVAELYENQDQDQDPVDGWTFVDTQEDGRARWRENMTLVLKSPEGDFYGVDYGLGLTEDVDNDLPWRDSYRDSPLPDIELVRLYPHTVTTTIYRTRE